MVYLIFAASVIIVLGILIAFLLLDPGGSGGTVSGTRRTCPICGRRLSEEERVFADEIKRSSQPNELKIKGCTHCYDRHP